MLRDEIAKYDRMIERSNTFCAKFGLNPEDSGIYRGWQFNRKQLIEQLDQLG